MPVEVADGVRPQGLCAGGVSATVFTSPLGALGGIRVRRRTVRPGEQSTLKDWGATSKSKSFPIATTRIFGSSTCGDMLIYNKQGEAGFLSHENSKAYSLGSVSDALNWIFDELRQGRTPEFDYERLK